MLVVAIHILAAAAFVAMSALVFGEPYDVIAEATPPAIPE